MGDYFSASQSEVISKVLLIFGILVALLVNWLISSLMIIIYFIWGILYNKEPYKWKATAILGWFSNIIVGVIFFLIGWLIV